ncbi:segregation and condensation protein A [Thermovibrio sp.]
MEIKVETPVFEGPLELLIYLIRKREVSIYDIPIAEVTEEFLNYIYAMQELNIPLTSEFLLMAATLARIKSEFLIPKEEEEDPRKELVQIIEEYLRSKRAVKELRKLEERALRYLKHDPSELIFKLQKRVRILNTKEELALAFKEVLKRSSQKKLKVGLSISSETFKVSEKVEEIKQTLRKRYLIKFSDFIRKSSCKLEAITYFLALLEIVKSGHASTFTDGKEIFVSRVIPLKKEEVKVLTTSS